MRKLCITLIILIIGFGAFLFLRKFDFSTREPSIEIEPIENTRYTMLEKTILNSTYFKDATISGNDKKDVLTIDNKYDISIKTGYYQMTIKDQKQEGDYCKIVDAIEQGLGLTPGRALETCEKTLSGSINLGGISAEIYDTYKILTVNMEVPAILFNSENSHESGELISVEEINYNILVDNYLITSMNLSYKDSSKIYSVCGNIYSKSKKDNKNLKIEIYDEKKAVIDSKTYKYENTSTKYIPFCVDYTLESNTVKYFSIKEIKKK